MTGHENIFLPREAQIVRAEIAKEWLDVVAALAVTRNEFIKWFGVSQVESALARHEKFTSERGHGVVHVHAEAVLTQHFSGH